MTHIGIVGCSAEGAALCYRTICERDAHPEVTMHTLPLADYVKRIDAGDWRGVGELMLRSAQALHRAGAEFLICPDNIIHQSLPFIEALRERELGVMRSPSTTCAAASRS